MAEVFSDPNYQEQKDKQKRHLVLRVIAPVVAALSLTSCSGEGGNNAIFDEGSIADVRISSSPIERFVIDYINGGVDHPDDLSVEFRGLYNSYENPSYLEKDEQFAKTCFAGTAYDPMASEVRGGDISAIPSVIYDSTNPDQIIIAPASPSAPKLTFSGYKNGDILQPEDIITADQLMAYGC